MSNPFFAVIIPDDLVVIHREHWQFPMIQILLNEADRDHIADVGLSWSSLEVDPRIIEACLADGVGNKHRRLRDKKPEDSKEPVVETFSRHIDMVLEYRVDTDMIGVLVIIEDRKTQIKRVLKFDFKPQDLGAAATAYREMEQRMRRARLQQELIMRFANILGGGGTEQADLLISNLIEVIDQTEIDLHKLNQGRLMVSNEEREAHKKEEQRERGGRRARKAGKGQPAATETQTEEVLEPQVEAEESLPPTDVSEMPLTARAKRLFENADAAKEDLPTTSEEAPVEQPTTEMEGQPEAQGHTHDIDEEQLAAFAALTQAQDS